MHLEKYALNNTLVKNFALATVIWGFVGMLVGVIIAIQLYVPWLNLSEYTDFFTFGRIRPLHTNAVIFAFVGNAIFTAVYYSLPRLLKVEMWSNVLGKIHFWGWQLIIVLAAITLPLGYNTSKEYAELEWPIDILITVVWVIFGINMIMTMIKRREKYLYVAIWFYLASWITVALLHVVNSFAIPYGWLHSYSLYSGVQDALVQWWYGHNAVAFFLTTPFLGLMYYFLPKIANRPIYSYRLSILHFWTLIFIYIWAGPHHLLYTALPEWAQTLGTIFSIMLIIPSWGGMFNGLFTLRGAWDKVKEDPLLKFLVVGVTCYGMATFEGPVLSLKNVNAISHYSDWTIAHVHIGALGWNGFLTFAMLYWLIPKLYNTKLYSEKLASTHFWIGTFGIILYAIPMYLSAFKTYFMMKSLTPEGQIEYSFLEIMQTMIPFYILRSIGGTLYLVGMCLLAYNLFKTARSGKFVQEESYEAAPLQETQKPGVAHWHTYFERKPIVLTIAAFIVISIGGIVEFLPAFLVSSNVPTIASVKPYTPLELHGRDIYIREGCNNCHSQMIRPFRYEVLRYGEYSKAGESVNDHPFLFGSKRTGPDLARIGGKYNHAWHYNHMYDPASIAENSIMPAYPMLFEKDLDILSTQSKIHAMRNIGVPYEKGYESKANDELKAQAQKIAMELKEQDIKANPNKEIIALIAYLQRLGTDINAK
ncbi:MAG: cytochrome-c oxidase, cbb3-type subunit I [Chitinophagales bacterium]|jgi:cytochrome c oxidase cbb3-type subunit I/II|nr:cytochrome-c oxidase, cbb3-type subunit I [Chitinophagales bacterium]